MHLSDLQTGAIFCKAFIEQELNLARIDTYPKGFRRLPRWSTRNTQEFSGWPTLQFFVEIYSLSFLERNVALLSCPSVVCLISCSKRNLIIKDEISPDSWGEDFEYCFERSGTYDRIEIHKSQRLWHLNLTDVKTVDQWLKIRFIFQYWGKFWLF